MLHAFGFTVHSYWEGVMLGQALLFMVLTMMLALASGCRKAASTKADTNTPTDTTSLGGGDGDGDMDTDTDSDGDTYADGDTDVDGDTDTDTAGDSDTGGHTEQGTVAGTVGETDTLNTATGTDSEDVTTDTVTMTPEPSKESCRVFDFESPVLDAGASLDVGPELNLAPGISLGPYREIHEGAPYLMEGSEWCLEGQWLNGGPIQIDMDEALAPPVSVAVDVHMSMGPFAYLRLLNSNGDEVGLDQKRMNPQIWPTCIPPGVAEADGLLTTVSLAAHADEAVSTIVVAYTPVPVNWGYAVYLDNLTMSAANLPGTEACPWNADGEIEDTVPRCELGADDEVRVRYLCHDMPDTVDSCEDCDVECLQQIVRDTEMSINDCMTYPDEILCGPYPDTEKCCYIVYAHTDWCLD